MGGRSHHCGRGRRGFTLFELVLVLALMISLSGIVWVSLSKPLAYENLRSVANQVRAVWTQTRLDAMSSGEVHVFAFQLQSGRYSIELLEGERAFFQPAEANLDGEAAGPQLAEGVVFVGGGKEETSRSLESDEKFGQADMMGAIYFYPDGTCSSAELYLRNEDGMHVAIRLRGMTGTSTLEENVDAVVGDAPSGEVQR